MDAARLEALAAIHDAMAVPIAYTHSAPGVADVVLDGLSSPGLTGVLFHGASDMPFATGKAAKVRGYEIRAADLPFRPANNDLIEDDAGVWRVIDVEDYEEAAAFRVRLAVTQ